MKLCNQSVSLRAIYFVGKSSWHRYSGSSVWTKDQTGAAKSTAQMAEALRYCAAHHRLEFNGDGSVCRITLLPLPVLKKERVLYAYRCAGCGAWVKRRREAKPGQAVWCGGNRCLQTRVLRFTFGGDLGRAMRDVFRELAGEHVCSCGGACRDRLVPAEEEEVEVPATVVRRLGPEEVRALLQDDGVRSGLVAAVGSGEERVVGTGSLGAEGLVIQASQAGLLEVAPARSYIGGGRGSGGSS